MICPAYFVKLKLLKVLLTRFETLADKLALYSGKIIRTISKRSILSRPRDEPQQQNQQIFLDLDPGDFPLVCTYDHFLTMLKRVMDSYDSIPSGDGSKTNARVKFVDFKSFRHRYWTHFSLDLRKNLSVDLVFSEIMKIIKKSIHTCTTLQYLNAQSYQRFNVRVASNFPFNHDRSKVFRIFERYKKLKLENREIDFIDFVVSLLRRLQKNQRIKSRFASCFHEFYVDKIQNLRCIDISLLLTLRNNPCDFHFDEDTAQDISQDSTFRFQNVKTIFHDHFGRQNAAIEHKDFAKPRLFTLNHNYRFHQNILYLVFSVMKFFFNNFPDTVNKLNFEIDTLIGSTSHLFLKCNSSILKNRANENSTIHYEVFFDAEQIILTRNEKQRVKVVYSIEENALILTILQAKEMKFENVILFNFFHSTPDPVGWKNVQRFKMNASSTFDATKHAAFCSEFKHLYVSITRARIRFIIIEKSMNNIQSFLNLMTLQSVDSLIETTSISSPDFVEKIKTLQSRTSNDPHR